jgi:hypothetical protein
MGPIKRFIVGVARVTVVAAPPIVIIHFLCTKWRDLESNRIGLFGKMVRHYPAWSYHPTTGTDRSSGHHLRTCRASASFFSMGEEDFEEGSVDGSSVLRT